MNENEDDRTEQELMADFQRLADKRPNYGGPARMGDIVNQLIARRGYLQTMAVDELRTAWARTVGPDFANDSLPGTIRRGVLEVIVGDSVIGQELTFRKLALLDGLRQELPHVSLRDVRFRVGTLTA